METIKRFIPFAAAAAIGSLLLGGCAWQDLNPSGTATHSADSEAGSTKEIERNYPGATDINVTHAQDNPNYMSWQMPDGRFCTATASQTQNNGRTPGRLVAEPYCRPVEGK